jgi:hypothetical protein
LATGFLKARAIYVTVYVGSVSEQLQLDFAAMRPYARDPTLVVLHESHFLFQNYPHPRRPLAWSALPLHFPMLRLLYFANQPGGWPVPIFDTGLFRSHVRPVPDEALALTEINTQPVLIVGWPAGSEAVIRILQRPVERLASDDRSYIVVRAAETSSPLHADVETR